MSSNTLEHANEKKRRKLMKLSMTTEFSDFINDKLQVEIGHDSEEQKSNMVKLEVVSPSKKKRKYRSATVNETTVSENISDIQESDSVSTADAHQYNSSRAKKKKSKKKVREMQIPSDVVDDNENSDGMIQEEDGLDVSSDVVENRRKKIKRFKDGAAESQAEDQSLNGDDRSMSEITEVNEDESEIAMTLKRGRKSQVRCNETFSRFMDKTLNDQELGEEIQKVLEERQEELISINDKAHDTLKSLKIVVPFKAHPSREYETTLLKPPSQKIKDKIAGSGLEMKSGKFNLEEDNTIRKNWDEFTKVK